MNPPALGPPTPPARAAPGTQGSVPLTPAECVTSPGTRQGRRTPKERCQETRSFFLLEQPCLGPQGPRDPSLEPTPPLPPPYPVNLFKSPLPAVFHWRFQVCTCRAGPCALQSQRAAAEWSGASVSPA